MKKLVLVFLVAMSSMGFGATVAVGGILQNRLGVQAAEGGPLLTGANSYYLTVGSFLVPPVVTDAASVLAVVSSFIPLRNGSGVVTEGVQANGTIAGAFTGFSPQDLAARPVYVFLHNDVDYTSSTQIAVLRAITQVFPSDISSPGSVAVTSSLIGLVEVVGEVTDAPVGGGFDYVTMVEVVPEPSTALLGLLGLLGVVGLIRRR